MRHTSGDARLHTKTTRTRTIAPDSCDEIAKNVLATCGWRHMLEAIDDRRSACESACSHADAARLLAAVPAFESNDHRRQHGIVIHRENASVVHHTAAGLCAFRHADQRVAAERACACAK